MFLLYEALLYLVFLLASPWFALLGFLRGKYLVNLRERFGRYSHPAARHDLWIQAVSVGEVLAAKPIVTLLLEARPDLSLVVTTTTLTGHSMARRNFPSATLTYFPFDFSFCVQRFLRYHDPSVFVTLETEIWPNAVRHTKARGARLVLANARLSDRSFPRYQLLRPLMRRVVNLYDRILAREEVDRQRFLELGAAPERVEVTGNVKFDFEIESAPLAIENKLTSLIGGRKVFVAGSTVAGEDEILCSYFADLTADGYFVIVVPRKPERFELVAALLDASSVRFARRSEIDEATHVDLLLVDSIGELARLYRMAHVAFVGGSLVPSGGHNPIEPAAAGVPVCFGPHMSNFREIAQTFLAENAAVEVASGEQMRNFARGLLHDSRLHQLHSERSLAVVRKNRGASRRVADRILEMLP